MAGPVVALDAGGLIKRYGQQAQVKYGHALNGLVTIGYEGVGFGAKDLRLDLLGVAINLNEETNPLTSANVDLLGFNKPWRTTEAGGLKFGFTTVLADGQQAGLEGNPDVTITPAAKALPAVTKELKSAGCDQLVLLVYGTPAEARDLARQFPSYDWVVAAKGGEEPPLAAEKIEGTESYLIEVGSKGKHAIAIGIYAGKNDDGDGGGNGRFRYQPVPLDHRFEDSPEMHQMMVDYQQELKVLGFDGLGVKPQLHPKAGILGKEFAGTAACVDCHDGECDIWDETPHSHATASIAELDPPRHFDPECLSCHATGWDPQGYHPYVGGFQSLDQTPHLNANGCENCHGPGAKHVALENGDLEVDDDEYDAVLAALHMEIVENEGNMEGQEFTNGKSVQNCMRCHDDDNSPDFDFQLYWPHVEHGDGDD